MGQVVVVLGLCLCLLALLIFLTRRTPRP